MRTSETQPAHSVLITDLDNTLWDWFEAWYASFSAMLARLSELSGVPEAVLEPEIRAVHQVRGTTEYSYLLNELPSLISAAAPLLPLERYDDAMHVLHATRRQTTELYPQVKETLHSLRDAGVLIVAYTESVAFWTEWRIKHTGLDGVIDILYSAPDHDLPMGVTVDDLRYGPSEDYGLKETIHRHVPRGELKPNEAILRAILSDCHRTPEQAVYVGDSLMKDIAMAQAAGVLDAHAKYGEAQQKAEYELLRRVSHWTDQAVSREREMSINREVVPTVTLVSGMDELLPVFGIERPGV